MSTNLRRQNNFDLFDRFFNNGFTNSNLMKTDIEETDGQYLFTIEVPGLKKDDIKLSLDNGYLNISTSVFSEKSNEDKERNYITKERYSGNQQRSYYVGDGVHLEDITAKFENGLLKVSVNKVPEIESEKLISIE